MGHKGVKTAFSVDTQVGEETGGGMTPSYRR